MFNAVAGGRGLPDAEVVRLVLDNLNTHKLGSLYPAHRPTPRVRWLNMATRPRHQGSTPGSLAQGNCGWMRRAAP